MESLRRLFQAVDARLQLQPSWRGAELERLLDHDHAMVQDAVAKRLERAGWIVHLEVTYELGRQRGSIDVLGLNPGLRAAFVAEIKTDVASSEAVGRKLDEKARLAVEIVRGRFGWTPLVTAAVLVMPESPRLRRLVGTSPVLNRMFPIGSRQVERWLREPVGALAATWFLSGIVLGNPRRIRRAGSGRGRKPVADPNHSANVDEPGEAPIGTVFRSWE